MFVDLGERKDRRSETGKAGRLPSSNLRRIAGDGAGRNREEMANGNQSKLPRY